MNDHPDDAILTQQLRESLASLTTAERPALAAITSRGRAHQRRRLTGLTTLGAGGALAVISVALGLTGVLSPAATHGTSGAQAAGSPRAGTTASSRDTSTSGPGTIQTDAFTLTVNANGTDTLTLTHSQMFNASELQQALTSHGIPALVKTGEYCTSSPAPSVGSPLGGGPISIEPPVKPSAAATMIPTGRGAPSPQELIDNTKTVINPAKIPAGTELFFGYASKGHAIYVGLIYTSNYTCSTSHMTS